MRASAGDRPPPDYDIACEDSSLRSRINGLLADKEEELRTDAAALRKLHPQSIVPGDNEMRETVPTDQMISEALLSSRLPLPFLRQTKVGPSSIAGAGRGLFATVDIPDGEVITCYPGDAVLYEMEARDDGELAVDVGEGGLDMVLWGAHVPSGERWDDDAVFDGTDAQPPLTCYGMAVGGAYSVMGHPALDDDPAYHGHYANDGAGHLALEKPTSERNIQAALELGLDTDPDNIGPEENIAAYVMKSIETANAMHIAEVFNRLHVATVATRDIRAGDEIFVTYGPDYWAGYDDA